MEAFAVITIIIINIIIILIGIVITIIIIITIVYYIIIQPCTLSAFTILIQIPMFYRFRNCDGPREAFLRVMSFF